MTNAQSKGLCMQNFWKLLIPAAILWLLTLTNSYAYLVQEETLLDNGNIYTVYNNPQEPTVFTISNAYQITYIETYHWNNQKGKGPGQISLKHSDGTVYGPWQASSRDGQWNVPNAYWFVSPYEPIKAGTYTIIDSDPSTWSQNNTSGNRGFAVVKGYRWFASVDPSGSVLEAINGHVTDFRFFEQPYEGVAYNNRVYTNSFKKDSTRYIAYELHLEYTASDTQVEIPLTVKYFSPDGSLFSELDHTINIEAGWTWSWHSWNTGWREPGKWPAGQYTVKVFDNDREIAMDTFTVQDTLSSADIIFNWLESVFPEILTPAGQPTYDTNSVLYRHYPATDVMIGTFQENLYFLDWNGKLYNLGEVNFWLSLINNW